MTVQEQKNNSVEGEDHSPKVRRALQKGIAGPRNMAKAVGNRIASRLIHHKSNSGILNTRPLATISEPHICELAKELPSEQFRAPSVNTSIHETICSSSPPTIPNRRVSMDTASVDEYKKKNQNQNNAEGESSTMVTLADSLSFDRFSDDTIACTKAPPSKPFKRSSMDSGFRDSMASTISALTMDASFASELGKLKEASFVSVDQDSFCLDLEDSFVCE